MSYHYIFTGTTAKIKSTVNTIFGKDAEQLELLYITIENAKWYDHFGI